MSTPSTPLAQTHTHTTHTHARAHIHFVSRDPFLIQPGFSNYFVHRNGNVTVFTTYGENIESMS